MGHEQVLGVSAIMAHDVQIALAGPGALHQCLCGQDGYSFRRSPSAGFTDPRAMATGGRDAYAGVQRRNSRPGAMARVV